MTFRERLSFFIRFINYWFKAVDEHSLHAPFAFRFYMQVIKPSRKACSIDEAEAIRRKFLRDHRAIDVTDLGAGSTYSSSQRRRISSIARHSLSERKLVALLVGTIKHMHAKRVLELGTSLGITSRYLAQAGEEVQLDTFEGAETVHQLALNHLGPLPNVTCHLGNIDEQLPAFLSSTDQVDLAYVDANHTLDATLKYFELLLPKMTGTSVMVIGDIHWSAGMAEAWQKITERSEVAISLDLFHAGLLFFMPYREKQHYIVRF